MNIRSRLKPRLAGYPMGTTPAAYAGAEPARPPHEDVDARV